jgi:hypothetical protein
LGSSAYAATNASAPMAANNAPVSLFIALPPVVCLVVEH